MRMQTAISCVSPNISHYIRACSLFSLSLHHFYYTEKNIAMHDKEWRKKYIEHECSSWINSNGRERQYRRKEGKKTIHKYNYTVEIHYPTPTSFLLSCLLQDNTMNAVPKQRRISCFCFVLHFLKLHFAFAVYRCKFEYFAFSYFHLCAMEFITV